MDRLALVLDICVDCYLDAILHEALEGHDVLAREQARVEGELDVHRPFVLFAVNSLVAVTGLPSASSSGSPVDLTMSVPVRVYVPPNSRFS